MLSLTCFILVMIECPWGGGGGGGVIDRQMAYFFKFPHFDVDLKTIKHYPIKETIFPID